MWRVDISSEGGSRGEGQGGICRVGGGGVKDFVVIAEKLADFGIKLFSATKNDRVGPSGSYCITDK